MLLICNIRKIHANEQYQDERSHQLIHEKIQTEIEISQNQMIFVKIFTFHIISLEVDSTLKLEVLLKVCWEPSNFTKLDLKMAFQLFETLATFIKTK